MAIDVPLEILTWGKKDPSQDLTCWLCNESTYSPKNRTSLISLMESKRETIMIPVVEENNEGYLNVTITLVPLWSMRYNQEL